MKTKVIAKSLVFHGDKMLLVRRSKTAPHRALEWDLPGGMVEAGEDVSAGAARELAEETNLSISPEKLYLAHSFTALFGGNLNVVRLFFVGKSDSDAVRLSHEHDKYQWVTIDEAINMEDGYKLQQDVFRYISSNKLIDDLPL